MRVVFVALLCLRVILTAINVDETACTPCSLTAPTTSHISIPEAYCPAVASWDGQKTYCQKVCMHARQSAGLARVSVTSLCQDLSQCLIDFYDCRVA